MLQARALLSAADLMLLLSTKLEEKHNFILEHWNGGNFLSAEEFS